MAELSDRLRRLRLEQVIDFGVRGFLPEPRRGFRTAQVRLERTGAWCAGAWERHELRSGWRDMQLSSGRAPRRKPRDWRELYARELVEHPVLFADLEGGHRHMDGIERVLERAGLREGERLVLRAHLVGDEVEEIAEDLGWRVQTVVVLLENGKDRLRWLNTNLRGIVGDRRNGSGGRAGAASSGGSLRAVAATGS